MIRRLDGSRCPSGEALVYASQEGRSWLCRWTESLPREVSLRWILESFFLASAATKQKILRELLDFEPRAPVRTSSERKVATAMR